MKTFLQILFFFLLVTQICFAQWVQSNGPYGGAISELAGSGTNLFAEAGGIYLSTDNGISWEPANTPFPHFNQMVPMGQYLFAGTENGVFLSTDNGTSWTISNNGLPRYPNGDYKRIECFALSGTNLFAGTDEGVFLTTNNGTSWNKVSTGLTKIDVWSLAVSDTNLFAGIHDGGVFLSTNNGTNWTPVNNGMPSNISVRAFAVSGENIFAGTWGWGIYFSSNNGSNWTSVNTGLMDNAISALAVSGTNLFAGTGDGVFLSTNNGTSWTAINNGLICPYVLSLAVLNTNLFAGTQNGVFLSTNNGLNWRDVSNGMTSRIVSLEAIGTSVFAGMCGGVYRLDNNETSWTRLNLQLPIFRSVSCFANIGSNLFAGTTMAFGSGPGVFLSTDNGTTWSLVNNGLADIDILDLAVSGTNIFAGTESGVFLSTNNGESWAKKGLADSRVSALAVLGTNIFAGTSGGGVFISSNNGDSWSAFNEGLPKNQYGNIDIASFALIGTNIFAGIGTYPFYGDGGVALSTNNGISWTVVNNGLTNININSLAVSGTNPFAWTDDGVFLSTNNGSNWFNVNQNLPQYMPTYDVFNCLVVNGSNLFAGTEIGVWKRPLSEMIIPVELTSFTATANGKEVTLNWSTATELNNQGFEVQRKFGSNNFVTVGSVKGNGTTTSPNQYSYVDKLIDAGKYFYRLKQIDYGGTFEYSNEIEVEVRVLDKFTLEQNYPNPFNPTTTIGYVLQEKSNAKLTLLNTLGEEIAVLVNEEQDKGFHKVEFNAVNLPSGVYFYRIHAGNYIETKKMLLLR